MRTEHITSPGFRYVTDITYEHFSLCLVDRMSVRQGIPEKVSSPPPCFIVLIFVFYFVIRKGFLIFLRKPSRLIPRRLRFLPLSFGNALRRQPLRIHKAHRVIHTVVVQVVIPARIAQRISCGEPACRRVVIAKAKADETCMRIHKAPGKAQGKEELRQGVPGRVAETIVCDFFYQDAVCLGKRPYAAQLIRTDAEGEGTTLPLSEQRISDIIFVTFSVHTRETRPRSKDAHGKEGNIGRPQTTASRSRCLGGLFLPA